MTTSHSVAGGMASPVGRVVRRWLTDSCPVPGAGEEEVAARCDRLADAVESLGKLPAQGWSDVTAKLSVLAARLRQAASAADRETMLTVLVTESIRDDVIRLAAPVMPHDTAPGAAGPTGR